MIKLATIAERLPEQELAIHRLYGRSPQFAGICADYCDAVAALRRWEALDDTARADEYRGIVADLEDEIRTAVAADAARGPQG